MTTFVNVAVEGCCHGELDAIYRAILDNEERSGQKVDLLVVCGDFECIRDILDLECLAVPPKYRKLNSFHQYVTGEKVAPVTTIFVGGNHEASNVLQSLYYGGYVAPKIYFMGFAGIVNFKGLRIAGLSGIFNQKHFRVGHFERPPYTEDTLRSVYHMRELEVYRMAHLSQSPRNIDIFLSHDWPANIWEYGNKDRLLKVKPFFRDDMATGKLGNPPLMHLLQSIKPSYWFAAHLHVKFAATVPHFSPSFETEQGAQQSRPPVPPPPPPPLPPRAAHYQPPPASHPPTSHLGKREAHNQRTYSGENSSNYNVAAQRRVTQFLALDKVLPGRDFIQFLQIPIKHDNWELQSSCTTACGESSEIEFDLEWLAVLRRTHNLLQTHRGVVQLPQEIQPVTKQELIEVRDLVQRHYGSLYIPAVEGVQPTVIAGECIPTSSPDGGYQQQHNRYGGRGNNVVGGGRSSRGRSGGGCNARQVTLFNPTSRVTPLGNAQTDHLLTALGLPHIWTVHCEEEDQVQRIVLPISGTADTTAGSGASGGHSSEDNFMASFQSDLSAARAKFAPTPAVPSAIAPRSASMYGDYGFHSYYGNVAIPVPGAHNSYSNLLPSTTAASSAATPATAGLGEGDPDELDIDTEETTATAAAAVAAAGSGAKSSDPDELDIDNSYENDINNNDISDDDRNDNGSAEEDPNEIDI